MNQERTTSKTISAQMIRAQMISAQMMISETSDASRRLAEVPVGDIDVTIAIMDAVAQFCASDPAAGRFARLFAQRIHPFEIATLADGLAAAFTQRLTTPAALRSEP